MCDSNINTHCIKQEQNDQIFVNDGIFIVVKSEIVSDNEEESKEINIGEKKIPSCKEEVPEQKPFLSGSEEVAYRINDLQQASVSPETDSFNSSSSKRGPYSDTASTGEKAFSACSDEVPELKPANCDTDELLCITLGINKCSVLLERCAYNSSYDGKYSLTGGNNGQQSTTVNSKEFKCTECNYSSNMKGHIRAHINAVHLLKKDFKCTQCNYSCGRKFRLIQHVDCVHKKLKIFKCDKCIFSCFHKDGIKFHLDTVHKQLKNFKCEQCNYSCCRIGRLKRHVDCVHIKLKSFTCDDCVFSSFYKEDMKRHIDGVHKQLKNFKCAQCSYSCGRKSQLKQHVECVHLKWNFFKCVECVYSCFYKLDLKKHVDRVHATSRLAATSSLSSLPTPNDPYIEECKVVAKTIE